MTNQQYYYLRNNEPIGPVTHDALKAAFENCVIDGTTKVCRVGETSWQVLSEQPYFEEVSNQKRLSLKPRETVAPAAAIPPLGNPSPAVVPAKAYNPLKAEGANANNFSPNLTPEQALQQSLKEEEEYITGPTLATSWKMQLGLGVFVLGVGLSVLSYMIALGGAKTYSMYVGLIGYGLFTFYKGYCGE